jgi:hypothetical protein
VSAWIVGSAGVLLFVAVGCASGGRWQTESATAPGADIAAYASFGWLPDRNGRGDASEAPLSIRDANLRKAIRAQLVGKGYREVEANPDLRIGFETEARAKEQTTPPMRIGVGIGSWGGHVGTSVDASVPVGPERVTTVAEARLTIRAVDPKGNREVWIGSATGEVREGLDEGAVEKAVAAALDGFPARHR